MGVTTQLASCCLFVLACVYGCGVGGFQGSDNPPSQGSTPNALLKRVNGVASKGIIRGGTVSLHTLNSNGSVGALLKTTRTNAFGLYSTRVNLTGPTLVSVSGVYTDEATGLESAIPQDAPLRAAIDTISDTMAIAITPLTELAVRKSEPMLVANNIAAANKLVSDIFRVNIVTTQPLSPTAESFGNELTTQEQKDYTLVLAAVSQMAHDYYGESVSDAIASMQNDLTKGDTLGDATSGQFKAALAKFLQSDLNRTGIRDVNATNLANAGGGTKVITLATSGTLQQGDLIFGVTVTIAMPPGVTVRISDFVHHQVDSRAVYASGVIPSSDENRVRTIGRFVPASASEPAYLTVSLPLATSGSGLGEFLTIVCDLPVGAAYTASDFSLPFVKVVNGDGAELQDVTVKIN